MTKTRDKLDALVKAMPITKALKEEIVKLLDDLEEEAFERGGDAILEDAQDWEYS